MIVVVAKGPLKAKLLIERPFALPIGKVLIKQNFFFALPVVWKWFIGDLITQKLQKLQGKFIVKFFLKKRKSKVPRAYCFKKDLCFAKAVVALQSQKNLV